MSFVGILRWSKFGLFSQAPVVEGHPEDMALAHQKDLGYNPLLAPHYQAMACPTPPRTMIRKKVEGHNEYIEVPCGNHRCPACGPLLMRSTIKRIGYQICNDRKQGCSKKHYAVTLGLRPHVKVTREQSEKLMDLVNTVMKSVGQKDSSSHWGKVSFQYIKVFQQGQRTAHVHLLLFVPADQDGNFPSEKMLRKRILRFWNSQLMRHLDSVMILDDPTGRGPGQIYLKKCRNVSGYLAYILWNKGKPWEIGWPCGKGKQRVRCSPNLLPPISKPQQYQKEPVDWLPGGVAYNISRFHHAGYAVVMTSSASFTVAASTKIVQDLIRRWSRRCFSRNARSALLPPLPSQPFQPRVVRPRAGGLNRPTAHNVAPI